MINASDILKGLSKQQQEELEVIIEDQRMDMLSTIVNDLGDYFSKYSFLTGHDFVSGKDLEIKIAKEKQMLKNVIDLLSNVSDELILLFIERQKHSLHLLNIAKQKDFRHALKPRLEKFKEVMEANWKL